MAWVAVGIAAVSTIGGAIGSAEKAKGEAAAAEYNQSIQNRQAKASIAQAAETERRVRVGGEKALGGIRAAVGASGINMEGSALDVLEESATNVEMDALTARHEGAMKAWAYREGAALEGMKADNARTAGNWGVASSILGGASSIYKIGRSTTGSTT